MLSEIIKWTLDRLRPVLAHERLLIPRVVPWL